MCANSLKNAQSFQLYFPTVAIPAIRQMQPTLVTTSSWIKINNLFSTAITLVSKHVDIKLIELSIAKKVTINISREQCGYPHYIDIQNIYIYIYLYIYIFGYYIGLSSYYECTCLQYCSYMLL